MLGAYTRIGTSRWSRAVVRVTLAVFILRALIPAGYMADLSALSQGHIQISICTADGVRSITLDADGRVVDEGGSQPGAAEKCPFGAVLAKSAVPPPDLTAGLPAYSRLAGFPPPSDHFALKPPALGPPIGPRAPPHLLG